MAQRTNRIHLKILLIGKTGHGKSATGNSILGKKIKPFKTSSKGRSETKVVADDWANHGIYEIQVIDGPGLEDTNLGAVENNAQACENMSKALMMCNGRIHAFVLVIKFGTRYTKEERKSISDLKQIFGNNYLQNHGIIVMTGGDSFPDQMEDEGTPEKTFEEWCCEQDDDFGNLIEECSPRVVLFNNLSKSEEEQTRQRNELLFHAGKLQEVDDGYTTEHFQAYKQVRDKYIKENKLKILEETIQKNICLLLAELGRLTVDSSLEDVDTLDARITDVYMNIGEESLQEESMQPLSGCLKSLRTTTEELRRAIREKNMRAMETNLVAMSRHQEELNKTREIPWGRIAAFVGVAILSVAAIATGVGAIGVGAAALAAGASIATGVGVIGGGVGVAAVGVVGGVVAVAASADTLVPVANSMGKVLLGGAEAYLSNKLLQQKKEKRRLM